MGWDFAAELRDYGPRSPRAFARGLSAARAYCANVARSHYENFAVASVLLPRRLVPHFHAVYAYCRWADDLAAETGERAPELLAWWRGEVQKMYAGEVRHPVFVALQDTVRTFAIPPKPFLELLIAFEQDQRVKRYATHEQLLGYCANSANPVGRLVLYLFECHDETRGGSNFEDLQRPSLALLWPALRAQRDSSSADAARVFDHAGQGKPSDP